MKAVKDSPVEPVYNSLSPDGCVGDHKPVFLVFTLRINEEGKMMTAITFHFIFLQFQ